MIKILLVDDHTILREGLKALLNSQTGLQVIGEAQDGFMAIRMTEKLRPDVVILDIGMPGINGLEVIRQLLQVQPQVRIIILSVQKRIEYIAQAIRNGARAYLVKETDHQNLILAIHKVIRGEIHLSPPYTPEDLENYWEKIRSKPLDLFETLTNRERLILQLVAQGMTNQQIAEKLGIGVRTVETHRSKLQHKLGLHGQAELVRFAIERGLIMDGQSS